VRNHSHGRRTLYLDYEAYESMALAKIREISVQLREKFPITSSPLPIGSAGSKLARPAFSSRSVRLQTGRLRSLPLRHHPQAHCSDLKKEYFEDAPSGPMAECLQPLWRHGQRNLHLSESMISHLLALAPRSSSFSPPFFWRDRCFTRQTRTARRGRKT
jgi:hypothetical protein